MIGTLPARPTRSTLARAIPMTLLLGATVVVSWVGVRGFGIVNGPGPWLHRTWLVAWAVQALLAAGLLVLVEWVAPSASRRAMLHLVLLAWLGELLAAVILVTVMVGELDAVHAPAVWLIGTGFGIQPAAAIIGGLIARRRGDAVRPAAR